MSNPNPTVAPMSGNIGSTMRGTPSPSGHSNRTPSTMPECTRPKSKWSVGDSNSKVECKCTSGTKQVREISGKNEWWCKQ